MRSTLKSLNLLKFNVLYCELILMVQANATATKFPSIIRMCVFFEEYEISRLRSCMCMMAANFLLVHIA